jgi:putative ABC transport system permease protein
LDPTSSSNRVAFGLIKLNEGESAEEIAQKLQSRYRLSPSETSIEVLTRDEVIQFELDRWLGETPIGFIFTLGVLISLVVGAAIVNMVLGNDVASRLHEYATLRAMGYSNIYLSTVVLRQALLLAVFSFVPALGLAFILYSLTGLLANLTMEMNLARIGFVLLLTLLMCVLAGTLSLKKLWQAEPADLF